VDIYTEKKVSPVGQVNKADLNKWVRNMAIFLAPLGIVYLGQISMTLQTGALGLRDFIPTPVTLGAIELYVINSILDFLKKLTDGSK
jgi:hypothetical protein